MSKRLTTKQPTAARLITRGQLCERWGMSRSTSYRLQDEHFLPAPMRMGRGVVRWSLAEIEKIEAQAAADRETAP